MKIPPKQHSEICNGTTGLSARKKAHAEQKSMCKDSHQIPGERTISKKRGGKSCHPSLHHPSNPHTFQPCHFLYKKQPQTPPMQNTWTEMTIFIDFWAISLLISAQIC